MPSSALEKKKVMMINNSSEDLLGSLACLGSKQTLPLSDIAQAEEVEPSTSQSPGWLFSVTGFCPCYLISASLSLHTHLPATSTKLSCVEVLPALSSFTKTSTYPLTAQTTPYHLQKPVQTPSPSLHRPVSKYELTPLKALPQSLNTQDNRATGSSLCGSACTVFTAL